MQITSNDDDEWFRDIKGSLLVWAPCDRHDFDFEVKVYDTLSGKTWQLTNNTTDDGFLGSDPLDTLYPHDYVAQAAARRVTTGTAAGTFEPWKEITRAQVITMIMRSIFNDPTAQLPALPADFHSTLGNFHPIHGETMRWAEYLNFMDGIQGFGPDWNPWAPATRGEVAWWLVNLMFR